MPAEMTSDDFLAVLKKSQLVDAAALEERLQLLGRTPPREPQTLARHLVKTGLLTFYQVNQLLHGRWNGYFLGNYKVLERLGSGVMGQVYLCVHKHMRRLVAIKILPTAQTRIPVALERFYREARASASLDHPNIVHAYDINQSDKLHYLIMEFVDGHNLEYIVAQHGRLDVTRAVQCMIQAARGMQGAHEAGWVHRDIKPSNLLLERAGVVKVLDMGLARLDDDIEDDITQRNHDNSILGSTDYMAPEQALDSSKVDVRADIYALGCTFYYLLTGRPPFVEGTMAQKLVYHQAKQPDPIRSLRPEVPAGLVAVIEKMMAKSADQRYQSPNEVAEALVPWRGEKLLLPPEEEMPKHSPAVQRLLRDSRTTILLNGNTDTLPPAKVVAPAAPPAEPTPILPTPLAAPAIDLVPPPTPARKQPARKQQPAVRPKSPRRWVSMLGVTVLAGLLGGVILRWLLR